jgi:twitching motility protein PilT
VVREAKTYQIGSIIQTGQRHGMQTLDQSLANLVTSGVVTWREAYEKAGNPQEFIALAGPDPDKPKEDNPPKS